MKLRKSTENYCTLNRGTVLVFMYHLSTTCCSAWQRGNTQVIPPGARWEFFNSICLRGDPLSWVTETASLANAWGSTYASGATPRNMHHEWPLCPTTCSLNPPLHRLSGSLDAQSEDACLLEIDLWTGGAVRRCTHFLFTRCRQPKEHLWYFFI